jgi:hypothetical protein
LTLRITEIEVENVGRAFQIRTWLIRRHRDLRESSECLGVIREKSKVGCRA